MELKVALVHDWLVTMGGAERVLAAIAELFPEAPIYTLVLDRKNLPLVLADREIYTSLIQKFPLAAKKYQAYLPFMPMAVEQFDLTGYDLVISSNHACAKGVITRPDTLHICYCHTPMRYAWEFYHEYLTRERVGGLKRALIRPLMNYLRIWDVTSANRVDYFIANSTAVAERIHKHYRREAVVIHPPVETTYYQPDEPDALGEQGDYYLVVSRLVGYKRIDLAVEAFNRLGYPLVIIGDGSQRSYLEKIAGPNIQFLGRQLDEAVRHHLQHAKAFVFPGEEDFGITPVEAQAAGCPVIAYGKGGALDTVVDGNTGVLFAPQSVEALMQAVKRREETAFEPSVLINNARKFDREAFKEKLKKYVQEKLDEFQNK